MNKIRRARQLSAKPAVNKIIVLLRRRFGRQYEHRSADTTYRRTDSPAALNSDSLQATIHFVSVRPGNKRRVKPPATVHFHSRDTRVTQCIYSQRETGGLGFGGGVRDSQGAFGRSGVRRRSVRIYACNQARLGVLCISLFLCSCGGNGTSSSPPTITSVTVASSAIAVLSGQTLTFTAWYWRLQFGGDMGG